MGGILLTHLQNLPCNAHTLEELEVPPGSVKDSVQVLKNNPIQKVDDQSQLMLAVMHKN